MKIKVLFILLVIPFIHYGQTFSVDYDTSLTQEINETSGLIFFNGSVFTINDSGNEPYLYQLDTLSGEIVRKIYVNGSNHDWEALAQDDEFVYIGDIGNNDGTRTDLKIYKIAKNAILSSDTVPINSIINFQYGNQTDFTPQPHNTPFDAEAIVCLNDTLILFSKNWTGNTTYLYKIPTDVDSCTVFPYDSLQLPGMVTGADLYDSTVYICGYNHYLIPFLSIYNLRTITVNNLPVSDSIGPGQTEGIATNSPNHLFITREKYTYTNNGNEYVFDARLYRFSLYQNPDLSPSLTINHCRINPNPAHTTIHLSIPAPIKQITITGINGQIFHQSSTGTDAINISSLPQGTYIVHITDIYNKTYIRKFIKE